MAKNSFEDAQRRYRSGYLRDERVFPPSQAATTEVLPAPPLKKERIDKIGPPCSRLKAAAWVLRSALRRREGEPFTHDRLARFSLRHCT